MGSTSESSSKRPFSLIDPKMSIPTLAEFLNGCELTECAEAIANVGITEKYFAAITALDPSIIEKHLRRANLKELQIDIFLGGITKLRNSNVLSRGIKRTYEGPSELIYISEERLDRIMKKWDEYPVNLLRSPPASGKTTLSKVLTRYLVNQGYAVKYISFANWEVARNPDLLTNSNTFDEFWMANTGATFREYKDCVNPTAIIIDEAQVLYDGASSFWDIMKPLMDDPNINLRILLLSMYEDRSGMRHKKTPVDFMHALGLDDLRLTNSEYTQITDNYIEYIREQNGTRLVIPDDLRKVIFNATLGHPQLIRWTLEFVYDEYQRGKRDEDLLHSLVSYDYFTGIQRSRVFDWMKDWNPTAVETEFLRRAYNDIDADSTFNVDINDINMKKVLADFMYSGLITYSGNTRLQFAAPLVRIIMGKHLYTAHLSIDSSRSRAIFEEFLLLSIERMRPSVLSKSLSHGPGSNSRLLERAWQNEWMMAASTAVPSSHTISPDVSSVYSSSGFLDFYVNGGLKWGIELMREGQKMNDHIERFTENGRYSKIPFTCWAIIDFRHNSLKPHPQTLEDDIWYAIYANDYSTITIMRKGKEEKVVTLQGDNPTLISN